MPDDELKLLTATNETLINALKVLTHRLHASDRDAGYYASLRSQRDRVEGEILRRMGG